MADMEHITLAPKSERSRLASDIVLAGGLGFISGLRPVDLENDRIPIPEKVEAQVRKIFSNLEQILSAVGRTRSDIAFVRIHLVDFDRLIERVNKTYLECIAGGRLPALTAIGVTSITRSALVEMDFVIRTSD